MPKHDNCEDLQVESCVDDNGQSIQGGDSYSVPTGRYVKHVVSVCDSGGGVNAGGLETRACDGGGLEETWQGPDALCLSIKTEDDSALVLDNGVLKIDSTKLKVTSDNVLPAGTDPGLLTTGPVWISPEGDEFNNQSDVNQWIYADQKRQDEALEDVQDNYLSKYGDTVSDAGDVTYSWPKDVTINSDHYLDIKGFNVDISSQNDVNIHGDSLINLGATGDISLQSNKGGELVLKRLTGNEQNEQIVNLRYVKEDQKRQDDEFQADQERQDNEIESLKELISSGGGVGEPSGQCDDPLSFVTKYGDVFDVFRSGNPDVLWVHDMNHAESIDLGPTYASLSGDRTQSGGPQVGEWLIAHEEGGSGYFKGKVVSISRTETTPINPSNVMYATHYELEGVEDTFEHGGQAPVPGWHTTAKVCTEESINEDATYNFVTHPEFETDQKRQDDALAEEILARAERDTLHDAQINTIEYKLDALLGLQFKGVYEFKHENDCNLEYERCVENCMAIDPQDHECRQMCGRNQMDCEREKVRPGYFEAVDPDDQFDHLEYIVISKSDKAGVEIEWANVLKKDDYLEVDHTAQGVLDKTNYGLYRIIEEPVESVNAFGEEVYTLHLEFLQGDGVMNVRENYEIRGITAAEGVSPEELGDFLTKDEAAATYALKQHGHPWGEITGKPSSFPPSSHSHSDYLSTTTTSDQTIKSSMTGTYFYGLTSGRSNGMMCRSDIEALVANSGGGSDGSDHNHDSKYVKGNYTISYSSGSYYIS